MFSLLLFIVAGIAFCFTATVLIGLVAAYALAQLHGFEGDPEQERICWPGVFLVVLVFLVSGWYLFL